MEFGRGVSFFDAIYGFAVTMLIANVDAPPAQAWRSLEALAASGVSQQLLGFVLSFVVIVVFWRLNVRLTRRLRGMDAATMRINLVATGLAVLIPFTTQGISDTDTADLPLPTILYAVNIALMALMQTLMYQVARARGLERVPTSQSANRRSLVAALITPAVFLASVPVALTAGASAAKLTWALLIVLGPLSGVWATRALGPETGQIAAAPAPKE